MDKPKLLHAVWTTSYIPLIGIGVGGAAVGGGLLYWLSRRRAASATTTKPTPTTGEAVGAEAVKCSNCGTENTADQKFCTNCGEKLTQRKKHQA